jgi:hypothetical protein
VSVLSLNLVRRQVSQLPVRVAACLRVSHWRRGHTAEYNGAKEATHFLQLWIRPHTKGLPPSYEQKTFSEADKRGKLRLIASPDGKDRSVTVHAHASIYAGLFDGKEVRRASLVSSLDPSCFGNGCVRSADPGSSADKTRGVCFLFI